MLGLGDIPGGIGDGAGVGWASESLAGAFAAFLAGSGEARGDTFGDGVTDGLGVGFGESLILTFGFSGIVGDFDG